MRGPRILFTIVLAMAWFSLPAQAQPVVITAPGPGNHFFIATGGGVPPMPPVIIPPLLMGMQAARLTGQQQKQMEQILQANRAQTAPLIGQLQSVHEQIADKLLAPGKISAGDLASLEEQADRIDAHIQQQALNASVQIRSILAPEQIARMAQFHQKMSALQAQMRKLVSEASQQSMPDPAP